MVALFCNDKQIYVKLVKILVFMLVMGRTPFHQTLDQLEYHFLNIERTLMCSSIGDQT